MAPDPDPERDAANRDDQSPPKLIKFRHMTGIDTPSTLHNQTPKRAARNLGIYTRVVSEERKATYRYYVMSLIINSSFLGQIVIAATLTALSAAGGPHLAVTILGSANTIIAGIQTYLKGQGLPNRIRQYQFGLRKLREYIEDRERDFSDESCKLDVDRVIAEVSAMYQTVRQTAEDNRPDTYLPMEGAGKKLLGQKDDRVTAIEQLGSADQNREPATIVSKDIGVGELMGAEEVGAEAIGSEAGSSSADQKKQNKPAIDDKNEATPLLKHGES